jgi:hypothetical protein
MLHVKQIRTIVDSGKNDEAHAALDQLLALGPQNTEALKLRAQLFEFEGRFAEEAGIWDRIAAIDHEDAEAVSYLLRRQVEDREHFYFTDDIPGGGRRFMAYPRNLVNTSAIGLAGCVAFLLTSRLSLAFPVLADPVVMLCGFAILVVLPWISIVLTYFTAIRHLSITAGGVEISTRIKTVSVSWPDMDKVCIARSLTEGGSTLSLVLVPKDRALPPVEIDLHQRSTPIRARSYLVREIARLFNEPEYATREALGLDRLKKIISF